MYSLSAAVIVVKTRSWWADHVAWMRGNKKCRTLAGENS